MQFILQIYKKLCSLFSKKSVITNESPVQQEEDELVTLISIDIDKNNSRVLSIYIPEDLTPNKIAEMAEIYASIIIDMNNGKLAKDTISVLNSSLDEKDENQKLFADNIIYFWTYLSSQEKYKDIISGSEPLIKPSMVFKKI